jgi:hypothetical protein
MSPPLLGIDRKIYGSVAAEILVTVSATVFAVVGFRYLF